MHRTDFLKTHALQFLSTLSIALSLAGCSSVTPPQSVAPAGATNPPLQHSATPSGKPKIEDRATRASARSQDPIFEKIQPATLTQELQRNSKNADALVELIRKSIESQQVETAYITLDELRREQPNNAVVLAAYVMAHDAGLYQVRKRTGIIRERTSQENQEAESALKKSQQLDPGLWLPYTIEGFRLGYKTVPDFEKSLDLLHKAVLLAPKSFFARQQFAKILQLAAVNKRKWNDKAVTHQQAAAELEIAHQLNPRSSDVAFALFSIYDIDLKNKIRATRAKRAFLKTLPPGYNLSKSVRQRLARYPN